MKKKIVIIAALVFAALLSGTVFGQKKHVVIKKELKGDSENVIVDTLIDAPDFPDIPDMVEFPDSDVIHINLKGIRGFALSPEIEAKYLKNIMPRVKKELEGIKRLNKTKYFNLLRDFHFENFGFPPFGKDSKEARERRKKITELEVNTEALGLKYQKAEKGDRDKLKGELKEKLNELFELREANRKEEVGDLEERLKDLKTTLQERRDNKDEIVKKRMQELTGESRNNEW